MSIKTVDDCSIREKDMPWSGLLPAPDYVRDPDWTSLGSITPGAQEIRAIVAVSPTTGNYMAVTVTGNYTVDWGDGTVENVSSGVKASHSYSYSSVGGAVVGTSSATAVTFTDSGDLVNYTAHPFINGEVVSFASITTTTGISTHTRYYVVNSSTNSFQVASSLGGSALALTNNGSGTVYRPQYKTALFKITPNGGNLLTVDFDVTHPSLTTNMSCAVLEMDVSLPNATSLVLQSTNYNNRQGFRLLRWLAIRALGATSLLSLCDGCLALERVEVLNAPNATTAKNLFNNCSNLRSIGSWDFSSVQIAYNMFAGCTNLASVPDVITSTALTDVYGMFSGCTLLSKVPWLNTANVTSADGLFSQCARLKKVPTYDFSSLASYYSMFNNCISLKEVPDFDFTNATNLSYFVSSCSLLTKVSLRNTGSVTNFSSAFSGCKSLHTIEISSTAAATNVSNMFSSCYSLRSLPTMDLSAATNLSGFCSYCYALESVPDLNLPAATNLQSAFASCFRLSKFGTIKTSASLTAVASMFSACYAMQEPPLFNTQSVTYFSSMFGSCYSLRRIPAYNLSSAASTGLSGFCPYDYSLQEIKATGIAQNIDLSGCCLSAAALDEIYTALASVSGKTITVTGNPGTSGDTPSIATAKGWTVTG